MLTPVSGVTVMGFEHHLPQPPHGDSTAINKCCASSIQKYVTEHNPVIIYKMHLPSLFSCIEIEFLGNRVEAQHCGKCCYII